MKISAKRLLAGSLLLNLWFFTQVWRPLQRLLRRTARLAAGDLTALDQACGGISTINELRYTMASMVGHVQRAQAEGLTYRHALTEGQEVERSRIAHELHDDTVQSLVAIAQSIELGLNWLETDPARAKMLLSNARTQAVENVENLRRLIADLRPPALEELGIVPALQLLTAQNKAVQAQVAVTGTARRIGEQQELTLFRVAQEAIRNAQRHGNAHQIVLELDFQVDEVRLKIRDDGLGFTSPSVLECLAQTQKFGLLGMKERVELLQGALRILSEPGKGTVVEVSLPLDQIVQPAGKVRDPVCGATIEPDQAYGSLVYGEIRYYFCCPVCQGAFQAQPGLYVKA
jgi:signal transduction histidine kinase/YHS domain-containing protein